jgi:hypothetical protein
MLVVVAVAGLAFLFTRLGRPAAFGVPARLWAAPVSVLAGAGVLIALGFFRPSFTIRYLTPFGPGVLLGFVLILRLLAGRYAAIAQVLVLLLTSSLDPFVVAHREWVSPKDYNFEAASAFLAKGRPARLAFFWDHPAGRVMRPEQLDALGGFFFRRAGLPINVIPIWVPVGQDANPRLLAAASRPDSDILWIYDVRVRGTSADVYPPRIADIDPRWTCRDFGRNGFGIIACQRETVKGPA